MKNKTNKSIKTFKQSNHRRVAPHTPLSSLSDCPGPGCEPRTTQLAVRRWKCSCLESSSCDTWLKRKLSVLRIFSNHFQSFMSRSFWIREQDQRTQKQLQILVLEPFAGRSFLTRLCMPIGSLASASVTGTPSSSKMARNVRAGAITPVSTTVPVGATYMTGRACAITQYLSEPHIWLVEPAPSHNTCRSHIYDW